MHIRLTKRFTFSASHCLANPGWTFAENESIYGKCQNLHGHNYVLLVHLVGAVDPATGMLVNLATLKQQINHLVVSQLDHTHLNLLVTIPTAENLAVHIYNTIKPKVPQLDCVELWETENNAVVYPSNK